MNWLNIFGFRTAQCHFSPPKKQMNLLHYSYKFNEKLFTPTAFLVLPVTFEDCQLRIWLRLDRKTESCSFPTAVIYFVTVLLKRFHISVKENIEAKSFHLLLGAVLILSFLLVFYSLVFTSASGQSFCFGTANAYSSFSHPELPNSMQIFIRG